MFESHYGLTTNPFSLALNPEWTFATKDRADALTYLEYGLSQKAGIMLVTGEIGSGKTTFIHRVLSDLDAHLEIAVIVATGLSPDPFYRQVLSAFDIPRSAAGTDDHLAHLYRFLVDRHGERRNILLIIDEAQNLPDETIDAIQTLSDLQTDGLPLLQIVLVALPELDGRLHAPAFRKLAQRIALHTHIRPLDAEQTRDYIAYRMRKSGRDADLFTPEAIDAMYRHSGGNPRTINLIGNSALLHGFLHDLTRIDGSVVDRVVHTHLFVSRDRDAPDSGAVDCLASADGAEAPILERIRQLEGSLSRLKDEYKQSIQEDRTQLLERCRQKLTIERDRYDQLMRQYARLLTNDPHAAAPHAGDPAEPRTIAADRRRKYTHLINMVESATRGAGKPKGD